MKPPFDVPAYAGLLRAGRCTQIHTDEVLPSSWDRGFSRDIQATSQTQLPCCRRRLRSPQGGAAFFVNVAPVWRPPRPPTAVRKRFARLAIGGAEAPPFPGQRGQAGPSPQKSGSGRQPHKSGAAAFLQGFDEGGDDLKQIADDAVVGNFEDGSVGVLVDGDHGARAFHPDDVLDGAGDAEREI